MIEIRESSKKEVDPFYTGRICEQCGQDHHPRPTFEGVKTGMDIIPELLEFMKLIENPILRTTLA